MSNNSGHRKHRCRTTYIIHSIIGNPNNIRDSMASKQKNRLGSSINNKNRRLAGDRDLMVGEPPSHSWRGGMHRRAT